MTRRLRAHFDGKVLVPDQPVDLPVNQPLDVDVAAANGKSGHLSERRSIQERLGRIEQASGILEAPILTDEALRRENLYDDRL